MYIPSPSYPDPSSDIGLVTALTSKRKASSSAAPKTTKRANSSASLISSRDGLGAYTLHPQKYDASRIIYSNENFVAINDLYPKSSVHTLLLPRDPKFNLKHPFDAFEDARFLEIVRVEVKKLKTLVAKELRRKYGPFSKQDEQREAILNGDIEIPDGEELPEGRDWEREVRAGIHAHPSMNHLHVHVMSVDRYSDCLKHRKHYNSFATDFFVPIEDFPLARDDRRMHPGREGYLSSDMKCWRCGKNFGNKFARLKQHLAEEFEEWRKE
jgi:aprataxin